MRQGSFSSVHKPVLQKTLFLSAGSPGPFFTSTKSPNLTNGSLDDAGIDLSDLFVYAVVVVTRIVDEYHPHNTIEVVGVLVVNGNASLILECLTDTPLEKILVEIRKKECIQRSLTFLDTFEVTHLIYSPKKIICK
jgi:hypothetical protein